MPYQRTIYEDVTARIIAELEAGRLPWVQPFGEAQDRPWADSAAPLGMPGNASTHRYYSGINILILWDALMRCGFPSLQFLTFKQALALGGCVKKGERGTTIVHASTFTPKGEIEKAAKSGDDPASVPFLKRYTVFNVVQCEGLPPVFAGAGSDSPGSGAAMTG